MGQPAARLTDNHTCPMTTPSPHVGGPILPPCEPTDHVNTLAHARATDKAQCTGPVDFIVTGAATVLVGGKPATRVGERTMHGGVIVPPCSPDVFIGGPSVGTILGNPEAGRIECEAAAAGRTRGSTQQSYQNCGVESARQVIHRATGSSITEDQLLDRAMNNGWAGIAATRADSGATSANSTRSILADQGVPNSTIPQNMTAVQQAVAEGRGVITGHDAGALWGTTDSGGHAVLVTGMEYDSNGALKTVYINDTGTGDCGKAIPANQFEASFLPGDHFNATDRPIW